MTVPVKLQSNEGLLLTYALLDTGSQPSFCDVKLAEKLGAKGPIKQVSLSTLSSASGLDPISCRKIDLTVTGLDSKESVALSKVLTGANDPNPGGAYDGSPPMLSVLLTLPALDKHSTPSVRGKLLSTLPRKG